MARIKNGNITGAVGPAVFYTAKGKSLVRSKRGKAKKKGGKFVCKTNNDFASVSSSATPMITRLKEGISMPFTLEIYNESRGWILKEYRQYGFNSAWPLTAKGNMCQVNALIDLRDCLMVPLQVSDMGNGQIGVSIPAFNPVQNIKAPPYTIQVNVKVMASTTPFTGEGRLPSFVMDQYSFAYSDAIVPARDFVLNTNAKTGEVAIVAVAVEYALVSKNIYSKELKDLPAAIVAVGRMG